MQFAQKGCACISLSLNVPGFPKSNHLVKDFFGDCLENLHYHLKAHLIGIQQNKAVEICDASGDFYLVPCKKGLRNLPEIKQICEDFEEVHPLGRFIDVDLNDEMGNSVSSGKSKSCFLCQSKPAIECRRENAHSQEELQSFMFKKMEGYLGHQRESTIAKRLSAFALNALLHEISLTPKPGLVDKFSNGSHTDMNFLTFVDSSAAISGWFEEMAKAGFAFHDDDFTKALPVIRNIGLRMERSMFEATGNINTQKGLIFLMGLSLFACGNLFSRKDHFEEAAFKVIVKNICKDLVLNELELPGLSGKSHGEEIFQRLGFSGARGEAESGFHTVFEYGLPHLLNPSEETDSAMIKCFLAIAGNNNDTNILYRRGLEVLCRFQELCRNALDNFNDENYKLVIEFCNNENISPGGSADLLAVSIFLSSVIQFENWTSVSHYTKKK